jgi:RNA-splicing ligase RtcB
VSERIGPLERIDDFRWRLPIGFRPGMRVPGIVYADGAMACRIVDDRSLEQVANVATLPGIVGASLAMPDIHWGYGFPVGGVAAFDEEEGVGWGVYYDEVEVLSPATPKQAVAPSTTSTTIPPHLVELAKLGDDRPAPNGDEFVKSMLTFFTTEDADAMLAWAKANRRNVDMAIDVGCFALNVKWIRQSDAA